ncbi:FtsB/FtsL family cell division protein [Lacrimispora algidixylanolytica]|uniref:Cell division protein FtsL n=1 Tax=Lacrimispora algidixylanolytica TaxID=94868 RepID=A0A419T254_9FIRM|nr:cell division protein FtsL [Lacrimispora algidixylanolytica]RKD31501.1 cell division protein FtsL [Lacrimispora algidixylanolytica]
MAAKNNVRSYRNTDYVHGNAVRKAIPARIPANTPEEVRRTSVNHRVRRNREKALQMDLPYVLMLTVAVVCTLCICIRYLQLQSSITTNIHGIGVQEAQLEKLRTENNALEISIKTSVDLDHVYKVATEELGMVYANKDQILHYDKTESEYVRQNEDIPKY